MSLTVDPIVRGDDWEWIHTVKMETGGSIIGSRISMTWKYEYADADANAAAKATTDPSGGITIIDATNFSIRLTSAQTRPIIPGPLVVDIQYEFPDGTVKTEKNLSRSTRCLPDVTLDTAP